MFCLGFSTERHFSLYFFMKPEKKCCLFCRAWAVEPATPSGCFWRGNDEWLGNFNFLSSCAVVMVTDCESSGSQHWLILGVGGWLCWLQWWLTVSINSLFVSIFSSKSSRFNNRVSSFADDTYYSTWFFQLLWCCGRVKSVMRHSPKSRESKIFLLLVLKRSVFLFHTTHAIICILSSNFPDISHPQPWWWRVRDPPHLFGPRLGPHRVRCGVPFWRAVGHRALGQRGGTRERRGGRGRSIIRLHLRQRLLAGAGTHESGSHQPISRKHFVGLVTGDGEGSRAFHTMDVFSDKRLFSSAFFLSSSGSRTSH